MLLGLVFLLVCLKIMGYLNATAFICILFYISESKLIDMCCNAYKATNNLISYLDYCGSHEVYVDCSKNTINVRRV